MLRGATEAHVDALHAALRTVYAVRDPSSARVDPAGRTDVEIARVILLGLGLGAQAIDDGIPALRETCAAEFARRCPDDLSRHVIPGVPELLRALGARSGVVLSLVTGNLEPIARLKLARAGLGDHFARGQGAFGSDAEDRALLPGLARRRAGAPGAGYPRQRTILVGDTPRDIACARADRLRCIAVATGPYLAEQLADADAVSLDAQDLRRRLERELLAGGQTDPAPTD